MSNRPSAQAVPNPDQDFWPGYYCTELVVKDQTAHPRWLPCGARFIFRSSYEKHWLEEHAEKPRAAGGYIAGPKNITIGTTGHVRIDPLRPSTERPVPSPPDGLPLLVQPPLQWEPVEVSRFCNHPDCLAKNLTCVTIRTPRKDRRRGTS
jgi:hypothetical protein